MNKEVLDQFLTKISKTQKKKPENDEKRKNQARKNIASVNEARKQSKINRLEQKKNEEPENPFSSQNEKIISLDNTLVEKKQEKKKRLDMLEKDLTEVKQLFNGYIEGKKRKKEEKEKEIATTQKITNTIMTSLPNILASYIKPSIDVEGNKSGILKMASDAKDNQLALANRIIKTGK